MGRTLNRGHLADMTGQVSPGSPSYLSPSPIRSSPLSNPPIFASTRTPSPSSHARSRPIPAPQPRRASQPLPRPSRHSITPLTPNSPDSPASPQHPASPPLSRSQPLLGSYQLSLFHSRMSHAHQPHSLPSTSKSSFALHIKCVGKGKSIDPGLRYPKPLVLPFSATYYDLEDPMDGPPLAGSSRGASQSPWTANIDLEDHYIQAYGDHQNLEDDGPPEFPGYRLAPVGQLQIIIKTPSTAIKAFIVPYDLRSMLPGGRVLAREKTFVQILDIPDNGRNRRASMGSPLPVGRSRESLRYAIQLMFVCVEAPSTPSRRSYYLAKSIKVIFTSTVPERGEITRSERVDEAILPTPTAPMQDTSSQIPQAIGFSPGSLSRAKEWETVRKKWLARQYMRDIKTDSIPMEDGIDSQVSHASSSSSSTPSKSGATGHLSSSLTFDRQPIAPPSQVTSPIRTKAPLPFLSPTKSTALPTIHSQSPSRSGSPIPSVGRAASPQPLSIKTPVAQRYNKNKLRRGSGSTEERELSEKLRAMRLGNNGEAQ